MALRRIAASLVTIALLGATPPALALTKVAKPGVAFADHIGATVLCPKGTQAVSGGFESDQDGYAVVNRRIKPRLWRVEILDVADAAEVKVFAYCSASLKVSVVSKTFTYVDLEGAAIVTARCPRGSKAVAGGWAYDTRGGNSPVFTSQPVKTRAWQIRAFAGDATAITAYASCVKADTVDLRIRKTTKAIADGATDGTATACRATEELLSGGFVTTPASDFSNMTGPDLFYETSARTGKRGWTVFGTNYSQVGGEVTALAVCAR